MGFYLNSAAPYFLYKSKVDSPYFVDKSQLLEELFPFVEQGNKHYQTPEVRENSNGKYDRGILWKRYGFP